MISQIAGLCLLVMQQQNVLGQRLSGAQPNPGLGHGGVRVEALQDQATLIVVQ